MPHLMRYVRALTGPRKTAHRAFLLLAVAAAAATTFALIRATSHSSTATRAPRAALGPYELTMAQPLPLGAKEVSMGDAVSAFGAPIVLPDSTQVTASDVGNVWLNQLPSTGPGQNDASAAVAVTFPAQGLVIHYVRPPIPDVAAYVQNNVKTSPGTEAISLNGVPALADPQDPSGQGWGSITFVAGGTTVSVFGHSDEASLQAVAQSILDRAKTSG